MGSNCCPQVCNDGCEADVSSVVQQHLQQRRNEHRLDISTLLLASDPRRPVGQSYHMTEQLGRGSFGAIWQATSTQSGDARAVKVIKKSRIKDEFDKIEGEVEAMVRLDHPNVLKLYEYFEDNDSIYLVTELCTGGDFTCLNPDNNVEETRLLFRDLVLAIAYCHGCGIAHRDLKLENCLLKEIPEQRRQTKVIDFGLAAIHRPGDASQCWKEKVGTEYYIAPEVIDTSCPYGTKCDLWSVGVLLYIVVTGEHPFAEDALTLRPKQLHHKILRNDIREEPLETSCVNEPMRRLLFGLLVKDPDGRLSAQDALKSEWLEPDGNDVRVRRKSTASTMRDALAHVQTFAKKQRFQKAFLTIAVNNTESKEIDALRDAFMELDDDKSGRLSKEEITSGLTKYGISMSSNEVDAMFAALDADGTGRINYTEWLAAAVQPAAINSEKVLQEVFHFFDINRSGRISREELAQVLGDECSSNKNIARVSR